MTLRGHDQPVEVVAFAPAISYPYIRTLAGMTVRTA